MADHPHLKITRIEFQKAIVDLLRLDEVDRDISGNKWYKLKYNLGAAIDQQHKTILTFGGAYSNHIYATAVAAKRAGLQSIGVIRGEEILPLNDTLVFAMNNGMHLHYISRNEYKNKNEKPFLNLLKEQYGDFFLIPEGGSNSLAVKGISEILENIQEKYDIYATPVGTGGTMAGVVNSLQGNAEVLGFSALKGAEGLSSDIENLLNSSGQPEYKNWRILHDFHFGGYAKLTPELYEFIQEFKKRNKVLLDPIYTSKMMYGIFQMLENGTIPVRKRILAFHTGGLQGWRGMIDRYRFVDNQILSSI